MSGYSFPNLYIGVYSFTSLLSIYVDYQLILSPKSVRVSFKRLSVYSMSDNIQTKMKTLNLDRKKAPVVIASSLVARIEQNNQFILIGKPVNPPRQNLQYLLKIMPKIWNLEGLVHGRIVDGGRFHFIFPNDTALTTVLQRRPWNFNERDVVMHRWTPHFDEGLMNIIPLWVQMRGIPFHLIDEAIVFNIGKELSTGEVIAVDLAGDNTFQGNFVRACIAWNINDPLEFERSFQFAPGENTVIRLHYEKIRRYCEACFSLCHDTGVCAQAAEVLADDSSDDGDDGDNFDPPNTNINDQTSIHGDPGPSSRQNLLRSQPMMSSGGISDSGNWEL